jgi:hypothetical protein
MRWPPYGLCEQAYSRTTEKTLFVVAYRYSVRILGTANVFVGSSARENSTRLKAQITLQGVEK